MSGNQSSYTLATAFSTVLQHHQQLRVIWLGCLRSVRRDIKLPEEDLPLVENRASRLEALRPGASGDVPGHLGSIPMGLFFDAPDVYASVDSLRLKLWLKETVANYRAGKYKHPLKPWAGGRREGTRNFRDAEEFCTTMVEIMKKMNEYNIEEIAAYMRREGLKTKSDNLDSIVRILYRHAKTFRVNLPHLFTLVHHDQ
jgi:hypothetical protein